MTTGRGKRKLSVLLSADLEGCGRLMGEDEVATVRTVTSYQEIMASLIQHHRAGLRIT